MNLKLSDEGRSTVVRSAAAIAGSDLAVRTAWSRPTVTIINLRRTMAANGAYTDGGTGSSF